jgi:hypothetical protein
MAVVVEALLALWFICSLANQFCPGRWRWGRRFTAILKRTDPLALVPDYRYFAPAPPAFDLELLYRDRLRDGSVTPWRAFDISSDPRWRLFWNSGKRRYQAAADHCARLIHQATLQIVGQRTAEQMYLSSSYVAVVQYVAGASHSIAGVETQFLIAVSAGFDTRREPAIALVSPFFRL